MTNDDTSFFVEVRFVFISSAGTRLKTATFAQSGTPSAKCEWVRKITHKIQCNDTTEGIPTWWMMVFLSFTLGSVFGEMIWEVVIAGMSWVQQFNLLWTLLSGVSAAAGFGLANWLGNQVTPKSVRYRSGPNFVKKITRKLNKQQRYSRRPSGNGYIPPKVMRECYEPHSKFNHTGRNPRSYQGPSVEALCNEVQKLKMRVRNLGDTIYKELLPSNRMHKELFPTKSHLRCFESVKKSGEHAARQVLFNSGANRCITPHKDDFNGHLQYMNQGQMIDGIGKGLQVHGKGFVIWTFLDDHLTYRSLKLPCYYVPSSGVCIASIQEILRVYPSETAKLTDKELMLSGSTETNSLTVPYCKESNLPTVTLQNPSVFNAQLDKNLRQVAQQKQDSLTGPKNANLSEPEKELLRWHERLGHISIRRVQWMMHQGLLSNSERTKSLHSAASKLTHGPMCTACQFAKQRRSSTPGSTKRTDKAAVNSLKTNDLFPGAHISCDHFHCNLLGRLISSYGRERAHDKYKGGCIFVDHASGYIHVELQCKLNTRETLQAKVDFEEVCAKYGIVPQNYITDEGSSFTSQGYTDHLYQFRQTVSHAAPGGHHSNGIAERNIGTVMSISRAMLHHAALNWPDVADVELWPLALYHAVYLLNRIPREDSGRSPLELFSRKTWPISKFQDFHVWGCPTYVLDSSLAAGRQISRWRPRSARCVHVGQSSKQGHGVPLVLNLLTGKITAQYHVIFDDSFQTVESTGEAIDFDHTNWYETFGLTPWQYIPDEADEVVANTPPVVASEGADRLDRMRSIRDEVHQRESRHSPAPGSIQRENETRSQSTQLVQPEPPQQREPTRTTQSEPPHKESEPQNQREHQQSVPPTQLRETQSSYISPPASTVTSAPPEPVRTSRFPSRNTKARTRDFLVPSFEAASKWSSKPTANISIDNNFEWLKADAL